ncbi:MAG TPA: class I SAM-dependent methyltransferase, partial [Planctomycetota bacterium]|nr:class I SAM-dependent methyltransferase [Planctomycetota bacterium]
MKAGQASRTAVLVCMGRALADGAPWAAGFSDPTAAVLLPAADRARFERLRSGRPRDGRERFEGLYLQRQARMMAARTLAIDEAVREAGAPQLVILGAGLDGRAWRMPELRDDLEAALAAAGHDPARPTTWIWEGVVMYLTLPQIEATLTAIARRSAPASRLIVLYHSPAFMLHLIGWVTRRVGEPLRSQLTAGEMRALLDAHGFRVVRDDDVAAFAARRSSELARSIRMLR